MTHTHESLQITLDPWQTRRMKEWHGSIVRAHFDADCEPPECELRVSAIGLLRGVGMIATAKSDSLELGDVKVEFVETQLPQPARLEAAICTMRGNCPDQQDAMWINGKVYQHPHCEPTSVRIGQNEALLVICDGVSSSPDAARASRFAALAMAERVKKHPDWSFDGLASARHVRAAQEKLCERMQRRKLAYGASTTLVAAHIREDRLAVVNSGDSRAYLLRHDGKIERLSRDHTIKNQLLDSGEAQQGLEYASIYDALSDCLIADSEDSDTFAIHRETTTLKPGDRLILCSDGVHDAVDETAWLVAMARQDVPLWMVRDTEQMVVEAGAPDNFSVVALLIGDAPNGNKEA